MEWALLGQTPGNGELQISARTRRSVVERIMQSIRRATYPVYAPIEFTYAIFSLMH